MRKHRRSEEDAISRPCSSAAFSLGEGQAQTSPHSRAPSHLVGWDPEPGGVPAEGATEGSDSVFRHVAPYASDDPLWLPRRLSWNLCPMGCQEQSPTTLLQARPSRSVSHPCQHAECSSRIGTPAPIPLSAPFGLHRLLHRCPYAVRRFRCGLRSAGRPLGRKPGQEVASGRHPSEESTISHPSSPTAHPSGMGGQACPIGPALDRCPISHGARRLAGSDWPPQCPPPRRPHLRLHGGSQAPCPGLVPGLGVPAGRLSPAAASDSEPRSAQQGQGLR